MCDTLHQSYLHRSSLIQRQKVLDALNIESNRPVWTLKALPPDRLEFSRVCGVIHDQIDRCGRFPVLYRSPSTGEIAISRCRCRSRSCPYCSRIRGREVEERCLKLITHCDSPRFLTLTMKSSPETLSSQLKRLKQCFSRLRRTSEWLKHVRGGLSIIEITHNPKTGWHPHIHCVIDGTFWHQKTISMLWLKITGNSSIVDIRQIWSKVNASKYISKYIAKSWGDESWSDEVLGEMSVSVRGMRVLSTFGHLHGIKTTTKQRGLQGDVEHVCSLYDLYSQAYQGNVRAIRLVKVFDILSMKRRDIDTGFYSDRVIRSMKGVYRLIMKFNVPPTIKPKPPPPDKQFSIDYDNQ